MRRSLHLPASPHSAVQNLGGINIGELLRALRWATRKVNPRSRSASIQATILTLITPFVVAQLTLVRHNSRAFGGQTSLWRGGGVRLRHWRRGQMGNPLWLAGLQPPSAPAIFEITPDPDFSPRRGRGASPSPVPIRLSYSGLPRPRPWLFPLVNAYAHRIYSTLVVLCLPKTQTEDAGCRRDFQASWSRETHFHLVEHRPRQARDQFRISPPDQQHALRS